MVALLKILRESHSNNLRLFVGWIIGMEHFLLKISCSDGNLTTIHFADSSLWLTYLSQGKGM